ncbi:MULTISPECIES: DUF1127 domain-containing protein [unclassified Brucella]|uniref:DUF1127 domain-containing protein n=1 Tax=unclassified Brucella TaxID=2632610 RepID=UPI00084F983F|nr:MULTISPECIES: DUF1127 domain-containing protein [unclassified Brucella]APX68685.1 hypothetical protein BKD03_04575 [Brucella sp. 09RB8471]MRN42462.1 DUF1127 domain-containing protein [Brucella sp. 09RB8913]MRN57576.1 DUF1127 domain-containing protein [Brucella sp. 09RB8918]MRN79117.1 DUF1127 domain-containing protein [Brucella sp. 10RB9210]OEI84563.1 hypothetical protein BA060_03215 [Brucella sp. B13-0095]
MIATSNFTATDLPAGSGRVSAFTQMVKVIFAPALRRWTFSKGKRQVMSLSDFDDHMLHDIGLRREDIYTAMRDRRVEDPTRILSELAIARLRMEAARHIC